jgi:hypothetical protein
MFEGMTYLCIKSSGVISCVNANVNISEIPTIFVIKVNGIPCIGNHMEEKSCVFNEISDVGILAVL